MLRKSVRFLLLLSLVFLSLGVWGNATAGQAHSPVMWADVPDPSVIRVGDTYYMTSTTMHMNPGVPIMKSQDLVNWEIVNYVYDVLDADDRLALTGGENDYGRGSWASSLRYHDGTFYVAFSSQTLGKTYVFQTTDVERGPWRRSSFYFTHDMSLLFDEGRVFLVHGSNDIRLIELTEDARAVKPGGINQVIIPNASSLLGENMIVSAEGAHIHKIDGRYYIFLIAWPAGGMRTQLCFRADEITGPYEGRVVFANAGIAQGGLVDTPNGDWFALLFGDRGAVGRIPYLIPVTWEDGWPVFGGEPGELAPNLGIQIVKSDEFNQKGERPGAYHTVIGNRVTYVQADPPAGAGKELLSNGGFENGLTAWRGSESASISISNEVFFSGGSALKITDRESAQAGAEQYLGEELKPNRRYKFSARVRYDDPAAPANRNFSIFLHADGWKDPRAITNRRVAKGDWVLLEGYITLSTSEIVSGAKISIAPSWSRGLVPERDLMDFYIDDVSIIDTTIPELAVNGSFENGLTGWSAYNNAQLTVTDQIAASGLSSLQVTGLGAVQDMAGRIEPGREYRVSAQIRYDQPSAPAVQSFNIYFQDGELKDSIGSGTLAKGQWGALEGIISIPAEMELVKPRLVVAAAQTSGDGLFEFYIDEFSCLDVTKIEQTVSGENDYNGSNLGLEWQWNHNPDNRYWSLLARPGYLRLTTGSLSTSLLDARNTLTQRTFGPQSAAAVKLDVSNLKPGDYAGLGLLQENYAFVGVTMVGKEKSIVLVQGNSESAAELAAVPLGQDEVFFKVECDFAQQRDQARFYYSLDGFNWQAVGGAFRMSYTIPHFMGYRFALFNFATLDTGGYVDFDYFRVSDRLTGAYSPAHILTASLLEEVTVPGTPAAVVNIPVYLESLPAAEYTGITASFTIPDRLTVTGVEFNEAAITGDCSYTWQDGQLVLQVTGPEVGFQADTGLFAELKLKAAGFIPVDQTVVVTTDYIKVDGGDVVYDTNRAKAQVELKAQDMGAAVKIPGYGNPLRDYKLGADPYAIVYDGRVYVYLSSDEFMFDSDGALIENDFRQLNRVFVMSSDDLMNWTDHGAIPVAGIHGANQGKGIAKWAGGSWAPAAAHKKIDGKDKFFLYFSNSAGSIGVLTADTPIGPWEDPLGRALITHSTPGVAGVVWLFDPAVLVDDDGTAYLYFGGGLPGNSQEQIASPKTARVIQLGEDMISTVGEAVMIDAPYMFESSGIHKYNGKYYYSYCTNFGTRPAGEDVPPTGEIAYMLSDNPMGPFEYVTTVLKNPHHYFGVGGNNHHAIFEFNGEWYIVYHAQTVAQAAFGAGRGYRSPHLNRVEFDDNGLMRDIIGTREGVAQIKNLDPYERTEAETIAWQKGIATEICSAPGAYVASLNMHVTNIDDGDWIAVSNADFGQVGPTTFMANVAAVNGGTIEIRLDSPDGELIGTLEVTPTGGEQEWKLMECDVKQVTGVHNIFFLFKGEAQADLFNFDYWQFK